MSSDLVEIVSEANDDESMDTEDDEPNNNDGDVPNVDTINTTTTASSKKKARDDANWPAELNTFTFEDKDCIICTSENNKKGKSDEAVSNIRSVATSISYTPPESDTVFNFELNKLTCANLRRFAAQIGCMNTYNKSKYITRYYIAQRKEKGTKNPDSEIGNINGDENTKNYVRVINTIFHPDFFPVFCTLNDRKDRDSFETGAGANNLSFWVSVSNFCNDWTNIDIQDFLRFDKLEFVNYEFYLKKAIENKHSPICCDQQTATSCRIMIEGLIKIRSSIIANMKQSGTNDSDPWKYTWVSIKKHSLTKTVSRFSAYYFFMCCTEHHNLLDSVLSRTLDEHLKSNSNEPIGSPLLKKRKQQQTNTKGSLIVQEGLLEEVKVLNNAFQNYFSKAEQIDKIKIVADKKKASIKELAILKKDLKDAYADYYRVTNYFTGNNPMLESNPQFNFLQKRLIEIQQEIQSCNNAINNHIVSNSEISIDTNSEVTPLRSITTNRIINNVNVYTPLISTGPTSTVATSSTSVATSVATSTPSTVNVSRVLNGKHKDDYDDADSINEYEPDDCLLNNLLN